MPQVFPSTALRSSQAAVKQAANIEPAIITDGSNLHFLFLSERDYAERIKREKEMAAYEARMARGIERAKAGIARGEYVIGAEEAVAKARALGHAHG